MKVGIAILVGAIAGLGTSTCVATDDTLQLVQTSAKLRQHGQSKRDEQVAPQVSVFRRFDTDGNGGLDKQELAAFLDERRVPEPRWERADLNKDGLLSFDELLDCVANPAACYPVLGAVAFLRSGPQSPSIDVVTAQHRAQQRMEALESFGLEEDEAIRASRSNHTVLSLHLMPQQRPLTPEAAVCLDGSDAGFYFAPAPTDEARRKWIINFMGGSWCSTEMECATRANTKLGSSRYFPRAVFMGGLLSDNCTANPTFCDFNRVVLGYCDGSSFTGDRREAVPVPGHPDKWLFFRGRRILDATLDALVADHGLAQAEQVLLAGASAGGVAVMAHADYLHRRLASMAPALDKVRVVPLSGFFASEKSVEGLPIYPSFMARMVKLANSTHALNRRCTASAQSAERWKCIFADKSFEWTATPTFIVNSALDWWSTQCVYFPAQTPYRVAIADDGSCGLSHGGVHSQCADNVERCSPFEMFAMNRFIRDFDSFLDKSTALRSKGNGAFVHSCHVHAEALESSYWKGIKLRGTSMQEAVLRWWKQDGMPSQMNTHRPCYYGQGGSNGTEWPYQCNPSCTQ